MPFTFAQNAVIRSVGKTVKGYTLDARNWTVDACERVKLLKSDQSFLVAVTEAFNALFVTLDDTGDIKDVKRVRVPECDRITVVQHYLVLIESTLLALHIWDLRESVVIATINNPLTVNAWAHDSACKYIAVLFHDGDTVRCATMTTANNTLSYMEVPSSAQSYDFPTGAVSPRFIDIESCPTGPNALILDADTGFANTGIACMNLFSQTASTNVLREPDAVRNAKWTPDGTAIVCTSASFVYVVDPFVSATASIIARISIPSEVDVNPLSTWVAPYTSASSARVLSLRGDTSLIRCCLLESTLLIALQIDRDAVAVFHLPWMRTSSTKLDLLNPMFLIKAHGPVLSLTWQSGKLLIHCKDQTLVYIAFARTVLDIGYDPAGWIAPGRIGVATNSGAEFVPITEN
ncbi:hypothetical protein CANCADRAFT_30593 [Tortispora caseinolytica NRRL Y-17796]|uniref:Uncharacterized protein n=1 Tax=Tortispora caseinolytica NRRL Y-17796 TaxID=767744 RepID=A0A1E4TLB5_9ASCO|nr:hypothetical protein CANCADRAFT_30593 [Tortispora caseinolytica NRRL Y-17796]